MSAERKPSVSVPGAQPLDLLALDIKAKMTGYRNALAYYHASPMVAAEGWAPPEDEARVVNARAELGRAAAALAQWCGEDVSQAAPESHGARRARVAGEVLDQARARAVALAAASTCVACGGTGRKPGFDLDPCMPCGATGRT